jgi:hypothetical protein
MLALIIPLFRGARGVFLYVGIIPYYKQPRQFDFLCGSDRYRQEHKMYR